jgi:integrase
MVTRMMGRDLQIISKFAEQEKKPADWMGFAETTSEEHRNVIRLYASNIDPEMPLIDALVRATERLRESRGWKWSTTLKRAASLQGALAALPLYFKGCVPIKLKWAVVWVKQLSHYAKKAKEETPSQARPATTEEVNAVVRHYYQREQLGIAVAIMFGWLTASRLGCILQLRMEDVEIEESRFRVTFKRGKGVRLRGPYSVYSCPLPPQWMQIWQDYRATRTVRMFPESLTGEKLKNALRAINPDLEQRSIRRGALQELARVGTKEEDLMRFSGHTQVATLRRYLNWNQVNARVENTMAAVAATLVPTSVGNNHPATTKDRRGKAQESTKPKPKSSPKTSNRKQR